jgi:hypothetical protein
LIVGCSVLQEALRERVRSGERTCLMVRNTPSLEPFVYKNNLFAKTGSGQT